MKKFLAKKLIDADDYSLNLSNWMVFRMGEHYGGYTVDGEDSHGVPTDVTFSFGEYFLNIIPILPSETEPQAEEPVEPPAVNGLMGASSGSANMATAGSNTTSSSQSRRYGR